MGQFKHFNNAAIVFAVRGVEVVLDAVVAAARQFLGDLGPLVAEAFVELKYFVFFVLVDRGFFNRWVQVIVPPK